MSQEPQTFTVYFEGTAGTHVEVEAVTSVEAIELADGQVSVSLCHKCSPKVNVDGEFNAVEVTDAEGQDVTPPGLGKSFAETTADEATRSLALSIIALDRTPDVSPELAEVIADAREILAALDPEPDTD